MRELLRRIQEVLRRGQADEQMAMVYEITAALAAPEPDAMEIVRQVRGHSIEWNEIEGYHSCYRLPKAEAAALIADHGKRVPRTMLEFPQQPNKEGGWTIEYSYLEQAEKVIRENEYCSGISMEQVEGVLLFVEKRMKTEAAKYGYRAE